MITIRASLPPASATKRDRIWRCRSLSSAPPMISRWPARACPGLGVGRHVEQHSELGGELERPLDSIGWPPPRPPAPSSATTTRCSARSRPPRAPQLRAAFRDAVLRHHPDRAPSSDVATRRTSILNRAWAELRDPLRRLHYDHALEGGRAETLDWPLDDGEAPRTARRRHQRRYEPDEPSPWHQPQWRSSEGFRVPAEIFMAGPAAQERWIVENRIAGEDWRDHNERYWLRFAARHYAERGRVDDWLGALERIVAQEPPLAEIVDANLREAYIAAGEELRGAITLRAIAERHPIGSSQRHWAERELRVAARGVPRRPRPSRAGGAPRGERRAAPQLPRVARGGAELHRLSRRHRGASACRQSSGGRTSWSSASWRPPCPSRAAGSASSSS